jgi:hypothetical protein
MSRTRLAAALGVAALTLGATAAVAEDPTDTQTVTITVNAAPRSVTVSGNVNFAVDANEANIDEEDTGSSLSFAAGDTSAKILVVRSGDDLADLTLGLHLQLGGAYDRPTGIFEGTGGSEWTGTDTTPGAGSATVASVISANTDHPNRTLTWVLTGTAPSTGGDIDSTFTYTITDNE